MVKVKPQAERIVSESMTVVSLTLEILPRENQKRNRKLHNPSEDFSIFFSQATEVKQKRVYNDIRDLKLQLIKFT